jgi:DNA-binding CsgD family transcriptional regulator
MLISMAQGYAEGLTEREAEIYRLTVVNRLTQGAIGKQMGITQQAVSTHLAHARAKLPAPDLEAIRAEALALHEDVIAARWSWPSWPARPSPAARMATWCTTLQSGAVVRDYGGASMRLDWRWPPTPSAASSWAWMRPASRRSPARSSTRSLAWILTTFANA